MSKTSGVGLPALMFLVFLVLKLCGVIGWSWWWVTAPLWILGLVIIVGGIVAGVFVVGVGRRMRSRMERNMRWPF